MLWTSAFRDPMLPNMFRLRCVRKKRAAQLHAGRRGGLDQAQVQQLRPEPAAGNRTSCTVSRSKRSSARRRTEAKTPTVLGQAGSVRRDKKHCFARFRCRKDLLHQGSLHRDLVAPRGLLPCLALDWPWQRRRHIPAAQERERGKGGTSVIRWSQKTSHCLLHTILTRSAVDVE